MNLYTGDSVKNLIEKYKEKNGLVFQMRETPIGYGDMILYGDNLKTTIIHEVVLNEWSSGYKIRMYNKFPEKYQKMLDSQ